MTSHSCIKCAVELTDSNWWESRRTRKIYICIPCHKACSVSGIRKRCADRGGQRFYFTDVRAKTLHGAKRRAMQKGMEFSLTLENCPRIPEVCPVLVIPLEFKKKTGKEFRCPGTPSLDRVDNTKGYTPDNVMWISWRANSLKKDATPQELAKLAAFYNKEPAVTA
jgi:hypothetical protein